MAQKYLFRSRANVAAMIEHTLGCRWMLPLLNALRAGVHRPAALEKMLCDENGCISAKVLNERLDELMHFGIVERLIIARTPNGTPSHVEYRFTAFGRQFVTILEAVDQVQVWLNENTLLNS